jgi:hypothetical protein
MRQDFMRLVTALEVANAPLDQQLDACEQGAAYLSAFWLDYTDLVPVEYPIHGFRRSPWPEMCVIFGHVQ